MWHREMLTINATHSSIDFQIVFKATIGSYYEGDIAIDDVVFTPECRYIALYKKTTIRHTFYFADQSNLLHQHLVLVPAPTIVMASSNVPVEIVLI